MLRKGVFDEPIRCRLKPEETEISSAVSADGIATAAPNKAFGLCHGM